MNCAERRERLIDVARGGDETGAEMRQHLAMCEECGRFLEEQRALGAALARIAEENAAAALPAGVEARIFAEWAPRGVWRPLAAAALAAALAAGLYVARGPVGKPPARAEVQPFVEIPYVAPLAPYERASIERWDVPVAALIAAGFEVRLPDAAGTVKADVLVGQDGRPHAIRLVQEVKQ